PPPVTRVAIDPRNIPHAKRTAGTCEGAVSECARPATMLNACSLGAGQSRFDATPMDSEQFSNLTVVLPNLHWRYSGVTATNRMVAPRLARLLSAGWFGSDAPDGVRRLGMGDILRLRGRAQRRKPRIWHARRNNEMLV